MKKKKIITLLIGLTCFLECGVTPLLTPDNALYVIAAEEYESYDDGDFSFYLFGDHAELYKTKKTITKAIIPSSVKGLPVTKIDGFAYREQLVSVVIPDTVTTIQEGAFYGCSSLVSISIPDSVTEIERTAFSNCSALESINLPDSLTIINEYTFSACKSLRSVVIPKGVITIDKYAFSYCDALEYVNVADTVLSIGNTAFGNCLGLKEVKLSNYANIHQYAFVNCPSLSPITLPTTLIIPECITAIKDSAFEFSQELKNVVFHDNITEIGKNAFFSCISLETIYIPDSVQKIGEKAFSGCYDLVELSVPYHLKDDIINEYEIIPENVFIRNNKREILDYDIKDNKDNLCNKASSKSVVIDSINNSTFTEDPNDMSKNDFRKNYNNGLRALDLLQEICDKDGNIFAFYGEKDVVNIVPENNELKAIQIKNPGFTFGAAEIGDDDYIYILFGKELTTDKITNNPTTENVCICKYDMDGKQIAYLGLPIEKTSAKIPFKGGNANIKYKNGVLGILFDTNWRNGHQGSEFAAVNATDMTLIDFSVNEGSHSLGVSMIETEYGFAAIQMGDADRDRGINMNRYGVDSEGGFRFLSKGDILFHSSGIYEQLGLLSQNDTFLHMGGIAESNSTFALAGKGEKEYSSDLVINSDVLTEQYDVFVRIIDKSLFNADDLVNGTERRNVVNNNIADRNVIWLMECNDIEKAGNVKVVTLKTGAYCVLWEKFINDEFDSIRYVIIDEVGNILRNETGIYNARLSDTSIQPIVNDMTLKWAIADKEKTSIIWYSVNLDELVDKRIKGDANNDGKVTVADAVMLQKWLLGASTELTCWQNVDLCEDGQIDVFDLCLLKRLLLQK